MRLVKMYSYRIQKKQEFYQKMIKIISYEFLSTTPKHHRNPVTSHHKHCILVEKRLYYKVYYLYDGTVQFLFFQ